ncbi:MAG: putative metal-binding motif-containing protein [Alphaproteobacteria bacterium]|nr:putative metal-binding motif-containing protein [Alphaproteobacteria bacterium]
MPLRDALLIGLLAFPACKDPDCDETLWYPDADADGVGAEEGHLLACFQPDGYVAVSGDCDDGNVTVYPGAREICDLLDNDCDLAIDNGDGDGDGFEVCEDCDDTDPAIFPGAPEVCDGLDSDCDGVLPERELDADGDGALACEDCDEADPAVFPGAAEVCNGVDDDCDRIIDNGDSDGDGWVGCPDTGGRLDLVLVLDAGDESAALRAAFDAEALIEALVDARQDYRLLVLGADDPEPVADPITPATEDPAAALAAAVDVAAAEGWPRPLEVAAEALETDGRPGAARLVLALTAREDHSPGALDALLDRMGDAPFVSVSAIAGGWEGCGGALGIARPSPRLAAAAERTGGVVWEACAGDWLSDGLADALPAPALDCDDAAPAWNPGAVETCDGLDEDCDGAVDEDGDGDGFGPCDADCDDGDPAVFPGATERCDGVDDDCDGALGAGEVDGDGDGVRGCAGDCDDTDPAVFPGAVEVCGDGIDQDCSGDDGAVADAQDADGDGFSVCAGDCDDGDPAVFPDAPEDRLDEVDNDCDGAVDGADPDFAWPISSLRDTGFRTLDLSGAPYAFCGFVYDAIGVSSDGFAVADRGSAFDDTPLPGELRNYPGFASAFWVDLDPEQWRGGGRFLTGYGWSTGVFVVERPDAVTVVYDAVPLADGSGTRLSSTLTLTRDGAARTWAWGDGRIDGVIGFSCGDGPRQEPDSLPCVDWDPSVNPVLGFEHRLRSADAATVVDTRCDP